MRRLTGILKVSKLTADEFGALVIADEIQTGMGRTGHLFAYQKAGIQPDLIAVAKGLGGGFPMGAIIARKEIGEAMGPGSHGTTFGGNPLAVAAGNAVMDVLEDEAFFPELGQRISQLDAGLAELASLYGDKIAELRGTGFLRGIKLSEGYEAGALNGMLRDHKLLAVPVADNVLRLLPPLTISSNEVDELLRILHNAMKAL